MKLPNLFILDRIASLLKSQKKTQKMLCEHLGIKQQAFTNWKNGDNDSYMKHLPAIAEYLGVSIDFLLGKTDSPARRQGVKIPVLGNVAAGIPIEAITEIEDYEEITEDMASKGEYVALTIHGDSMEPRMLEGDVVIVRLQDTIESGETAIVIVNGGEATCKRVKKTPDGITLLAINPDYDPVFYSNKQIEQLPVRIFGKVVELRGKFK